MEGLLAVVGLEMTTEGVRTSTGTERWRERVPDFRGCDMSMAHLPLPYIVISYLACKERRCGGTSASGDENGQVDVWL